MTTDDEQLNWVRAADLADLPPGSAAEVILAGRVYALFRLGDEVSALDGLCPHQGGHLAESERAAEVVTCPRLGCLRWRFELQTGECVQLPRVRVRTYPVRVEGGSVCIALPRFA